MGGGVLDGLKLIAREPLLHDFTASHTPELTRDASC